LADVGVGLVAVLEADGFKNFFFDLSGFFFGLVGLGGLGNDLKI